MKRKCGIPKRARKIHINDEIWYWTYSHRSYYVIIIPPNREKKHKISLSNLLNMSQGTVERELDRRQLKIKPSDVKNYIENNF